jgi:ABC-type multidrug transport system permease subunit
MHFSDISKAEVTGSSFSVDVLSMLAYRGGGKWAVVALWLALAVMFLVAGFRARARSAGGPERDAAMRSL